MVDSGICVYPSLLWYPRLTVGPVFLGTCCLAQMVGKLLQWCGDRSKYWSGHIPTDSLNMLFSLERQQPPPRCCCFLVPSELLSSTIIATTNTVYTFFCLNSWWILIIYRIVVYCTGLFLKFCFVQGYMSI
jgi:hypothetical protein